MLNLSDSSYFSDFVADISQIGFMISLALLLIWTAGSGAWVGPGVNNYDLATCTFLLIVLIFKWSLVTHAILFHTVADLRSRSQTNFVHL